MQDGYVERFDQKISPRPSFPKRGITISPFGPLRQRLRGEQRGNKGDFVNCRSSNRFQGQKYTPTPVCRSTSVRRHKGHHYKTFFLTKQYRASGFRRDDETHSLLFSFLLHSDGFSCGVSAGAKTRVKWGRASNCCCAPGIDRSRIPCPHRAVANDP